MFVGTKRQAKVPVIEQAAACNMPYVNERWLGGTLTNFGTIRKRLGRLEELEAMDEKGIMAQHGKKMESMLRREFRKIKRNLDGIRNMEKMPGALVIVDSQREHLAINEAINLGIPTICLLDTDSDPDKVDIPIPGNDDAMRAIEIVLSQLADAVNEGKSVRIKDAESAKSEERRGRSRRASMSQAAQTPAAPAAEATETPAPAAPEVKDGEATA